jgi:hypothetical protein
MKRLELTPVEIRTLRDMGISIAIHVPGCELKPLCG